MKGKYLLLVGVLITSIVTFISGCSNEKREENSYRMINMDTAQKMFEEEGDYIILDVRHADEYADGHIKGAINIDNDVIGANKLEELPDKEQTIYVYCRSGNRSKQAAKKLVSLGYTDVIEIGGIIDWKGDIVK